MKRIVFAVSAVLISSGAFGVEIATQSLPAVTTEDPSRDQVIKEFLLVSGFQKSLQLLPEQITSNVHQITASRSKEESQSELAKMMADAFPKDGFVNRVTNALRKNYDEKRYKRMIKVLSTPQEKRMTELEAAQPPPSDIQNFISKISIHPLSNQRMRLIKRVDSATQSSAILTKIGIASVELNVLAVADDCTKNSAKLKDLFAKLRPQIEKSTRGSVQIALAYAYRDISDTELLQHLNTYESIDGKWMQNIINKAIEEEFNIEISKEAQEMKRLVNSKKPKQTMFAPTTSCNVDHSVKVVQ